ncbi:MAG TPA: hypothetical protein PK400_13070 [Phycisphaerales bacterium]|nr:hypothetical protein [Phycisphaerales bacterium]HRQ75426.1 hypothetical protein [Phycisphaerales bacterium]
MKRGTLSTKCLLAEMLIERDQQEGEHGTCAHNFNGVRHAFRRCVRGADRLSLGQRTFASPGLVTRTLI